MRAAAPQLTHRWPQIGAAILLGAVCACGTPASPPVEVDADSEVPEATRPEPAITVPFTDRLLPFDAERVQLSRDYLREHYGIVQDDAAITPRMAVLHWTAGPTADSAFATFSPTHLSGRAELQGAGSLNVSAHFLVDRDGTTWRLVPETIMARHVIGLNHVAVGIENVGGGERWPLTEAQVDANVALIRWLTASYDITHVIGHHEYTAMEGHPYWAERDAGYRTVKSDPGDAFMQSVRERVVDLQLSGAP